VSAAPLFEVAVADEAGTARLAARVAAVLRPGDVVALAGDLGAGKTAFARAAIRARAGDPDLEVPSPTFTLLQPYDLPGLPIAHLDLYRLADPSELDELGFDEAVIAGAALVEWPERAGRRLPPGTLTVTIRPGPTRKARVFAFAGAVDWVDRLAPLRSG